MSIQKSSDRIIEPAIPKQFFMRSLIKKLWIAAATLVIAAAVISSVFRALTPLAKEHKEDVEKHISTLLGQPVTIKTMETGWYWFQPVLKLNQVTISDGRDTALHLNQLLVGINLFKSLWEWQIEPGVLYIDDIRLVLRQKEGHWSIDGISSSSLGGNTMTPERTQQIVAWLTQQERLIIKHVTADLHFTDGGFIPISGLNISIVNRGGSYKFKGEARLDQTHATSLQLMGDLRLDPAHWEKTKGQIYFSAKDIIPTQWQTLFPKAMQGFAKGKGSLALWLDLDQGAISSLQAQINFHRLTWSLLHKNKKQNIQSLFANLSWKALPQGWQLNADQVQLHVGDVTWPENKLAIRYDSNQQAYSVYAQNIIIESLLAEGFKWPISVQQLKPYAPRGVLTDTQLTIQNQQLTSLLTRFDNLTWTGNKSIPSVNNLKGVLSWQPEQGHLELDSDATTVAMKGYPKQKIDLLNASLEWKELNDGVRLSIDRFVLSQKDLTLSAEGALDQVTYDSLGSIRLNADFSGKNIQQWFRYLPAQHIKPQFVKWLNRSLKQISEASGTIKINGLAKDFPFDNTPGEFTLTSHASGGTLLITPEWQLVNDLDAYIKMDKRNLNIDIVNADFHGAPSKDMKLVINDIGLGQETLTVAGTVDAKAQKVLDYIMASPLKKKLSTLKMLRLKGPLLANLQLEVPLYPEKDDVLVKGDLYFKNNKVTYAHQVGPIQLDKFTGTLTFDEKGIQDSALKANLFGVPVQIAMQSVANPEPYTKININGEYSVDALKNIISSPLWAYLKGKLAVTALLKITDNPNDFDSILVQSNLEGLSVNFPEPIGKEESTLAPSTLELGLSDNKGMRVRANYNKLISTDILLKDHAGVYAIKSGQVLLGSDQAVDSKKPGLAIEGKLTGFPLNEWYEVLKPYNTQTAKSDLLKQLRIIDVQLGKLSYMKQNLDNMQVKARVLSDKDWALSLKQANLAGDIVYHPSTNSISGYMHKLHVADLQFNEGKSHTHMHPKDIPNLNVRIDNLSIGEKQIGNMTLKTKSNAEAFNVDFCRVETPEYQFQVQGTWSQQDKANKTQLQFRAHINDLAKSLRRWNFNPALDAGKGDVDFTGGWNASLFDFSVTKLDGNLSLKIRKGIITQLSPEAEEKLDFGKLLSILSLQTIPRRLQLDFSDLSHNGYSFDIFKGDFVINKGIMSTQNSYLDGPVAYAGIKGDLDLTKRLYDLNLKISPHITASLPVVATIAGGPIAGVAAWVANKLINQGMQKIIAYSYKVSGPWHQPVVQQLTMVKKLPNAIPLRNQTALNDDEEDISLKSQTQASESR